MVSFVWFDIGYTLVYMQRETTYQRALRWFGQDLPLEEIHLAFHLTDKIFMREYPGAFLKPRGVYMPWYLGQMNHRLGIAIDVCALDTRWRQIQKGVHPYWLPYEKTHDVLETLKRNSLGLGVISNWDQSARDVLRDSNLIDYFDPIIISCEVGCSKPDPAIFRAAVAQAGVEPEACLYIGDNYYDDALGSRRVGMEALIINRYGKLGVEEITDCPIISDLTQSIPHIARRNGKRLPA
ncbi:MAG: HAD-IA family hydrolase [Desulfobacterales bacterium]